MSLDIIIPFLNEEESLPQLLTTLDEVFTPTTLSNLGLETVRYLFVDDGSRDRSAKIVCDYTRRNPGRATLLRLSRNFGHQPALSAGLDYSTADFVAIIDADLQDPPQAIVSMIAKAKEGFDVVYGVRKKRKESLVKVTLYWSFYRLLSFLSEVDVPLDSGDFCVIKKRVVDAMGSLPEKLRFPRGLRAWVGFQQYAFEYERDARNQGETKYSMRKLYLLATHGIASLSIRPLRITQSLAFISLFFTACFVLFATFKFSDYGSDDGKELWFILGYILIAGSTFLQMLCFYVLSAYIGRMYLEVKARPTYLIAEVVS